jgi:hypothetical protein
MIKDDVLVFDCVAHPFNFDPSNALGQPGEQFTTTSMLSTTSSRPRASRSSRRRSSSRSGARRR